jgi:hypothetical protein
MSFRAEFLPDESLPDKNGAFKLVAKHQVVQEKIRAALESDDGAWPEWQLLWEQHPLMEWLLDTLAAAYARHEAPVLIVPQLAEKSLFLFSTLVSNEDAQPVHTAWLALEAVDGKLSGRALTLDETLDQTGLRTGLTNPQSSSERMSTLSALVPAAVAQAREQIKVIREEQIDRLRKIARREQRRLIDWEKKATAALDRDEVRYRKGKSGAPQHLAKKLGLQRQNVARFKRNHEVWLKSLSAHGDAYVRLAAVFYRGAMHHLPHAVPRAARL